MGEEWRDGSITRAFRLVHDVQAGVPGAPEALVELAAQARDLGWDDVERACVFGEAVTSWIAGDGRAADPVGRLIEGSIEAADDVMLALGLALRSDQGFSGTDPSSTVTHDEDLARAIVILEQQREQGRGRPCERISAHTACGIALGKRWLFELSHEQYEAALAIGACGPEGSVDFLLAPILFNLAEEQVSWASKLYELGDGPGVTQRWESWKEVLAAAGSYPMSQSWLVELEALGLVLRAMAGSSAVERAEQLLSQADRYRGAESRAVGLLRLAIAVGRCTEAAAEWDQAVAESVEAAVASVSPSVHPFMYDVALFLAATLEARLGSDAGLRYAARVVGEQWAKRDAALRAMRAQVASVRLMYERDLLSRRARLDDLTGLANRWALEEFLSDLARRSVDRCALLLFDVDSFKTVNDLHGHLAGDQLLVRVAELLGTGIRSSDLAVRLGGDEFAVILTDTDTDTARHRAQTLVGAFDEEPLHEIAGDLRLRVSAGVAVGDPATIMQWWASADAALYEAKAAGGHAVRVAPVVQA